VAVPASLDGAGAEGSEATGAASVLGSEAGGASGASGLDGSRAVGRLSGSEAQAASVSRLVRTQMIRRMADLER
jgi:hypothetical protein